MSYKEKERYEDEEELEMGEIVEDDSQNMMDYSEQQYEYNETVQEEVEEERFFCTVCNHTSNSWESYQEHVVSQTHVERAARVFHLEVPTKKQLNQERRDKEVHHCNICDVNCNGDINWNAHLAGSKHQKRERQRKLEEGVAKTAADKGGPVEHDEAITQQEFIDFPEPLIGLEYITEIQIPGEPPCFFCELCDSRFSNNLKFAHVTGSKHRYKVIKEGDPVWAKSIQETCERRSDLTLRLANAARRVELQDGRKRIKARVESLVKPYTTEPSKKHDELTSYSRDRYGRSEDRFGFNEDLRRVPNNYDSFDQRLPSLMDQEIPAELFEEYNSDMTGIHGSHSENNRSFTNAKSFPLINRGLGLLKEEILKENKNQVEQNPVKDHRERSQSRERRDRHSRNYRSRSRERNERSKRKSRSRSRERRNSRRGRSRSNEKNEKSPIKDPRKRSRSRESKDRGRLYEPPQRRNRSRSPYSRVRSPRKSSPVDISEEIEQERKRQERRAEEKRRAAERKKRHAERERKEKEEEVERKKKEKQMKKEIVEDESKKSNRPSSPPPRAPAVLDEDTKRLVMQNLTELAKCCVTNEADAELALQVSNALTQALLQYRMKNMPESVLQTLNSSDLTPPPSQPQQVQQQPPSQNLTPTTNYIPPQQNAVEQLAAAAGYEVAYQQLQQQQQQIQQQQSVAQQYQQQITQQNQNNTYLNNLQQNVLSNGAQPSLSAHTTFPPLPSQPPQQSYSPQLSQQSTSRMQTSNSDYKDLLNMKQEDVIDFREQFQGLLQRHMEEQERYAEEQRRELEERQLEEYRRNQRLY